MMKTHEQTTQLISQSFLCQMTKLFDAEENVKHYAIQEESINRKEIVYINM